MAYTHLQVRSGYSLLKSTITIDKLVKKASDKGFKALALTDEHVLHGVIPFYQQCQRFGIKPIIGMIVHVLDEHEEYEEEMILLAKNNHGYKQLIQLSSHLKVNHLKGLTKQQLANFSDGLIGILSMQPLSHVALQLQKQNLMDIKSILQEWQSLWHEDDFYLGIQNHGQSIENHLLSLIEQYQGELAVQMVALQDVRYLEAEDALAYDCLQAIRKGERWSQEHIDSSVYNRHLRTAEEMQAVFGDPWLKALEATEDIQQKCQVTIDFNQSLMPKFPVPHSDDAHAYLESLCFKRLYERYTEPNQEAKDRLTYELDVIKSMDFSDYFLIVSDFVQYAKQKQIMVGPGRGSAAGSLVAYVLGITDIDPLKYGLLFERFLNPERVTMPDIDIDFSDHRRDEVIEYVYQKYGADYVAQIITFGTFAARSLLRELMKVMEINQQDVNVILRQFPVESRVTIKEHIQQSQELQAYIKQHPSLKLLFKIAIKLEGLPRHVSTHAAGVIISQQPLTEHVPLTAGSGEIHLTQFPMNDLEALGLLKMDFLGLRNLTLLERILTSISRTEGKTISLEQIPENDPKTYELLQRGQTNGVFQLESQGMKDILVRLKPNDFEDIVAVNALYRPGPMAHIPTYIKRKHKLEPVTYLHPDLEPILKPTYGVLVYQEQIMQILNQVAGYSYGEADLIRRAISKKQESVMKEQEAQFITRCVSRGYDERIARELFEWIVTFSNYGFNRSHAVAYSKIAYQLAYLKAHYPAHFFAELLTSIRGQFDKVSAYIKEATSMGLQVLPPSINKSFGAYTVEHNQLRMGLLSIKGIGFQTVKEILRARGEQPFTDLFDFCLRVSLKIVNRAAIEQLILAGAFDETYSNRASLLASLDQAMEQGELFGGPNVQQSILPQVGMKELYTEIEDFSMMRKLSFEKEILGIYMSSHPLKDVRKLLQLNGYVSLEEAKISFRHRRQTIKTAVILQSIKMIRTKRGEPMAFVSIGDETDDMDAVVFPVLYREKRVFFQEEQMVFLTGQLDWRHEQLQMIIQDIAPFDKSALPITERIFIKLTAETRDHALTMIKQIAQKFPGVSPIIVYDVETKKTYQLAKMYHLQAHEQSLNELKSHFGEANVVLESYGL